MAYATFNLNKIQFGRESTAGTAVDSSEIWRGGFANITDERDRRKAEEQTGRLVSAGRYYDAWEFGSISLPETELTFEQFPHLLEMGIMTATATGSGPYVRPYEYPVSGAFNALKTYTVEAYNVNETDDFRELHYGFASEITMKGEAQGPWMMGATIQGQKLFTGAATALTTLIDVEEALVSKTALYVDATGGTIGTTQISGVFLGGEVTIKTGIAPVPVGDGNQYFSNIKRHMAVVNFTITVKLESTTGFVAAERVFYEADTYRLVRLEIPGSDSRQVVVDIAAKWTSIGDYTNSDGSTVVTLSGAAEYSTTDAHFFSIQVDNQRASL